MSRTIARTLTVEFDVEIDIQDERAISRVVDNEDGWQETFYSNLTTEEDVLKHFAFNAAVNGVRSAHQLDGWSDLERDAVTMKVTDHGELVDFW